MNEQPPAYTDRQLKTFDLLQRNRMAWFVLLFLFAAFAVVLVALLYAAFSGQGKAWLTVGFTVIDGLLGTCITRIVFFLFPKPK